MDREKEMNGGPAKEDSDHYVWLAGAFVGGFLILTITIIIGIMLWKYIKKRNSTIDQNWAGPSPLADGNIQEDGNCMNSGILGRSMSLSRISTSPIISNEHLAAQEVNERAWENPHGNFMEEDVNEKKVTTIPTFNAPIIPAEPTKYAGPESEVHMSTQITQNGLKDEMTFLPPPPEELQMPPQPDNQQHFPEMNSYQQDGNGTQESLNLQISDTDVPYITNNFEDLLLPPPPPDL